MLATLSDEYGDIADAAIYVKGNVIRWVGRTVEIPPEYRIADTVMSMDNRVVIPGLVCCHHHMYQVTFHTSATTVQGPLHIITDLFEAASSGQCMCAGIDKVERHR